MSKTATKYQQCATQDKDQEASVVAKKPTNVFLYIATISVNLLSLGCGSVFSWTSPVIPKLKLENSPSNPFGYKISPSEESLIASTQCIGALSGPFIASQCADRFGRKKSLLLFLIPIVIANITLAFSTSVELYYFARLLVGIGTGCILSVIPMYVGEIAEDTNRGLLGCFMEIFITVGELYCLIIGRFTDVMWLSLISLLPFLLFAIIFGFFIPESPYYYSLIKDKKSAEESLRRLRNDKNIEKELLTIETNVRESVELKRSFKDLFKSRGLIRGLVVSVGLMFCQQFCGITAVIYYMEPIFQAAESSIPSHNSPLILSSIQVCFCFLTSQLIERLGRRILLIISEIGLTISLVILGIYFYLKDSTDYDIDSLYWLPLACMISYIVSFVFGIGPLAWSMLGELFPPDVKALAAPLTTLSCMVFSYINAAAFPHFVVMLGMATTLWILAGFCVFSIFFVAIFVPETKGKSLQEIQIHLSR